MGWWVWALWIYCVVAVVAFLVLLAASRKWPDLGERYALWTAVFWPLFVVYLAIFALAWFIDWNKRTAR